MNSTTEVKKKWRRAWDLNPRNFRLPVFKTGALGRYASPPWANLPSKYLCGQFEQRFDDDCYAIVVMGIGHKLCIFRAIGMAIRHRP